MIIKNLAMGIVVTPPSPATSGTTATLRTGEGAFMPTTFPFLATTAPPDQLSNPTYAEIILITGIAGDVLTFVRTKRGSSAKSIAAGWIIANGIYVEDVNGVAVTVATAAATATKVGTTSDADYRPALGDHLLVTFSSGMNVNSPTLNIDGGGAKAINVGNVAANTTLFSTTLAVTVPMWYDGTAYQLYGSYINTTSSSWVFNEVPTGTINGVNTSFTTTQVGSNHIVSLNGLVLTPGAGNDYTISGTTITMLYAPSTGSNLLVTYTTSSSQLIVGSNSLISDQTPTGTIDGTNKVFTTAAAYIGGSLKVFINGIKQKTVTHFVETTPGSGIFTMDDAPIIGDLITVEYQMVSSVTGNADTVDGIHASTTPTANMLIPLDSLGRLPLAGTARQNDTTNTSPGSTRIETGWGVMPVSTAVNTYSETVTYQTTFTDRPIVLVTFGGDNATNGGYGSGGSVIEGNVVMKAYSITSSNFIVYGRKPDNSLWGGNGFMWYQWIAIGA